MIEMTLKQKNRFVEMFKFIFILLRVFCQVTEWTECFQDGNKIKSCMWVLEHFKSALVVEKKPATFICDIKASNVRECGKWHKMPMQT